MFKEILKSELHYKSLFSEVKNYDNYNIYSDKLLKDMRGHNNILIKPEVDCNKACCIIAEALEDRKLNGEDFLKVTLFCHHESEILKTVETGYELVVSDYLSIKSNKWSLLKTNDLITIKSFKTPSVIADGRFVDIQANKKAMTEDFAIRRIDRKTLVYSDSNNVLEFYVAYINDEPVGNCEVLYFNNMAKIEDFDILEAYQRKGIGTHFLSVLLKYIFDKGIEYGYVVTDHDDSAKDMYKKCGFKHEGCVKELYDEFN